MVAGASGQLGGAVAEALADRCGARLVLGSRSVDRLAAFGDRVKDVRRTDFDDAGSLPHAFTGVDRLLLISTNDFTPGRRADQHRGAIAAAKAAGVRHVVYTSITRPEPGALISLAPDHYATERALIDSGLSWTILRNNCYLDFALMGILPALGRGAIDSAAGDGAIGYVTRADCAVAAAAALEANDFDNKMYDITGPAALTMAQLAAIVAGITGKPLAVREVSAAAMHDAMANAGLPPALVGLIVSTDLAAARGQLGVTTRDFAALTGRAPTTAEAFFAQHAPMLAGAAAAA